MLLGSPQPRVKGVVSLLFQLSVTIEKKKAVIDKVSQDGAIVKKCKVSVM